MILGQNSGKNAFFVVFHRFFLQVDKNTKIFKKFFEKLIFNKKYVFIKVFEKKTGFCPPA